MHAILTSVGTDGDLIPYVGIGTRLKARGPRVALAANAPFHGLATEQGVEFHPLVFDEEYRQLLRDPDIWHPTRSALVGIRWGKALLRRQYELIVRLAADPESVLVANPGVLAARLAGEKLSRPLASIVLQPWLIPSVYAMPTMPGRFGLPRWAPPPVVALYIRAVNGLGDVLVGRHFNRL